MGQAFEEEEEAPPPPPCSEGAPLWVISYGDMMTLLLCFFVLYFNMDVSNGLKDIANEKTVLAEINSKMVKDSKGQDPNLNVIMSQIVSELEKSIEKEVNQTYLGLIPILEKEIENSGAKLVKVGEKLELSLPATSFFSRGKAELLTEKQDVFKKVSEVLKKQMDKMSIEVEGHTDDLPIQGWLSRYFPSNWELSSARASTIIRLFQELELKPLAFSAVGMADSQPLVPNDSEEHRQLNRRVVIRISYKAEERP